MPQREHSELLLRKAAQDEFTVEKLIPDPESPDEVIGFHAQQAVEKILKAVLAHLAVPWRRTHDLLELIDTIRASGVPFPEELEEIRFLTHFAAAFRYDELPQEAEEPFDRVWALDCVRRTRAWARSILGGKIE